jgi:hypothetical protein
MTAQSSATRVRRPWLLNLYPRAWRRRYGDEVADMLAGRGFSLRTSVDLVAGAIDVWLHPSATLAAARAAQSPEEEKRMVNRIARLVCDLPDDVSNTDQWKSAGVMIGGTIILTLAWMALRRRIGNPPYMDALGVLPFLIPFLFSLRYTYLKGRPASVQAVFIAGFSILLTAFMLAAGWVAGKL